MWIDFLLTLTPVTHLLILVVLQFDDTDRPNVDWYHSCGRPECWCYQVISSCGCDSVIYRDFFIFRQKVYQLLAGIHGKDRNAYIYMNNIFIFFKYFSESFCLVKKDKYIHDKWTKFAIIIIKWLANGDVLNTWVWFHTSKNVELFSVTMGIIHDEITCYYRNCIERLHGYFSQARSYFYKEYRFDNYRDVHNYWILIQRQLITFRHIVLSCKLRETLYVGNCRALLTIFAMGRSLP